MKHHEAIGPSAIHIPWFYSPTDPALDPENEVGPDDGWYDTINLNIKFRNKGNTNWNTVGEGGDL